ncbi:MAG TPA: hypothetical protein VKW76_07040 [Candidatus Binatia bacterium]|nr:hypothetical protein [Candidatus Binatia bacterium]
MTRTCLHCVLARALRAEAPGLARARVEVIVRRSGPLLLPRPGGAIYRALRGLLREAGRLGAGGRVKVAVHDFVGKSHVEVAATVVAGGRVRLLGRAFARHAEGSLGGGFLEGLGGA